MKTVAIILLWIIFLFGAYSTISWCAGPELEDLLRGYNPLTGKQRRKMLQESRRPSLDRFLKNKCVFVWRSFNLLWKRRKNQMWHSCNLLGSKLFGNSTLWKILYWRICRWKINIQCLILKAATKLEQVSSWTNFQLEAFNSAKRKHWDSMGQGLIWAAYEGYLLEQRWNDWIRELRLRVVHTRSLWKLKWERTKHQLTQRLRTHIISLNVLALAVRDRLHVERQRLCLCFENASAQILSWRGNLYVEWWYTIFKEPPRKWAFLPNLWQSPKATSSTEDGVDDYAAADRRTATRRIRRVSGSSRLVLLLSCGLKAFAPTLWQYPMATSPTDNGVADYAAMDRRTATRTTCRVSGSSRLVLLFLCGLKLLHDAQRLRDPGQVVQRSSRYLEETNALGSILMEPGWQTWLCEVDKEMDGWRAEQAGLNRLPESSRMGNGKRRTCVQGNMGHALRVCCVVSLYGYAHPSRKVREVSRLIRVTPSLVAFDGPIDKG